MRTPPDLHPGRTCGHDGMKVHRTMNDAFGPYARLEVQRRAKKVDRVIGVVCGIIIVAGLLYAVIS